MNGKCDGLIWACLACLFSLSATAEPADGLRIDRYTSECEILLALNGSARAPARCRSDSAPPDGAKLAFSRPARHSLPSTPRPASIDDSLLFGFDSAILSPDARQVLATLAGALRDPSSAGNTYRLEGHTDAHGDAGYNLALSQRRAGSVRRYLISQGVPAQRLYAQGYGKTRPIRADPYDPANRRVQIVKSIE